MQMIRKNENGVTMIALIVTIVVLFIILGISLNYGLSEVHIASNKKTESELFIVQEAIMQRYALVKASNELGIIASSITSNTPAASDANRPTGFVGTRLASSSEITSNGFSGITFKQQYSSGASDLPYERYYYLLNDSDLENLGVEKGKDGKEKSATAKGRTYIVNYFTGEIFDVANKKYYKAGTQNGDPVYTQPTSINMDEKSYEFKDN